MERPETDKVRTDRSITGNTAGHLAWTAVQRGQTVLTWGNSQLRARPTLRSTGNQVRTVSWSGGRRPSLVWWRDNTGNVKTPYPASLASSTIICQPCFPGQWRNTEIFTSRDIENIVPCLVAKHDPTADGTNICLMFFMIF